MEQREAQVVDPAAAEKNAQVTVSQMIGFEREIGDKIFKIQNHIGRGEKKRQSEGDQAQAADAQQSGAPLCYAQLQQDDQRQRRQDQRCGVFARGCQAGEKRGQACILCPTAFVERQHIIECDEGQQEHEDIGHAEMRIAHVQRRHSQQQRRQPGDALVEKAAAEKIEHIDRRHSGQGGERPADQIERRWIDEKGEAQVQAAVENAKEMARHIVQGIAGKTKIDEQCGIVEKMRIEIAAAHAQSRDRNGVLVWAATVMRQAEPDPPEAENRGQQQDADEDGVFFHRFGALLGKQRIRTTFSLSIEPTFRMFPANRCRPGRRPVVPPDRCVRPRGSAF